MAANLVTAPFMVFSDIDGSVLDGGYIWVGEENLDPVANPVSAFWDSALTIPASQPIRTINGYPARNGSAANLYVSEYAVSIFVKSQSNTTVFSVASAPVFGPDEQVGAADIEDGAVTTPKLAAGALSADAGGRSKMADGFVTSEKLAVVALLNGSTATTQSALDNSTKVATTGYADAAVGALENNLLERYVVVQQKFNQLTTEVDISSPIIPLDTSKPQVSEGTLVLTEAITPAVNTNKVELSATFSVHSSAAVTLVAAVFRNGGADAVYAVAKDMLTADLAQMTLLFQDSPASASEVTYTVRIGPQTLSGTQLVNKSTYSLGGLLMSTLSLKEIQPAV